MGDLHRTDTPSTSTGAVKPSVADEARAKTNVTAAQAQQKTDATASVAAARTSTTVDRAEDKLEQFKEDMRDGKHRPHSHTQGAPGQDQGAFLRTIGVPQEAGTASDAPGIGSTNTAPISSGAIQGPSAPTGQGGVLAGTGAGATDVTEKDQDLTGPRKFAVNAADKAQDALANAKAKLFGGPSA